MGGCKISKWYVRKISETGGERPGGKRLRVGEWGGGLSGVSLFFLCLGQENARLFHNSDQIERFTGLGFRVDVLDLPV